MIISKKHYKKICDLGCGDGEYIRKLFKDDLKFYGIDASHGMINAAKKNMPLAEYEISGNGIHITDHLDFVYSSALFAHVTDDTMYELFENVYGTLRGNGCFVICEQIAPKRCSGDIWVRRTFSEYLEALQKCGFHISSIDTFRIDYWLHRKILERMIAKRYYESIQKEKNCSLEAARIDANKKKSFVCLSYILTKLSIPCLWKRKLEGWGYCFICAIKP